MVSMKALAVAAAAVSVNAASESICDKYTTALLTNNTAANQYTLLTLLVKTAALGNFTGPGTQHPTLPGSKVNVPGLLAKGAVNGTDVNLLPYFTGELLSSNVNGMPASVNWLDANATELASNITYIGEPGSNSYKLISHLFSYFGAALGCSTYGSSGFPAYAGDNSMTNVHKYMDLNSAQNTWFIENVGLSASSFGASDEDVAAVGKELLTLFNYRCAPPTVVIPNTPAELQAICLDESCPISPNATCAAYSSAGVPTTYPATASSTGSMMASSTGAMMSATGSSSMSATMTGVAQQTGAAVANGISGALAVLAGAAAFAL